MINFFRKIRKKLADDNKPVKYFRYAIGEILLVVIGILIALNINNWNGNRKQENRKKEITKSLTLELNSVLDYTQKQADLLDNRMELFGKILTEWETFDPKTFSKYLLDRYYWHIHTGTHVKYNPSLGFYNSLINSGEINLVSDSLVVKLNYVYEKHRKDVVTYVNQESDLHVLIAEVVARNHSKEFLVGKYEKGRSVLDSTSTVNFLNSIKDDGELKGLIFRNLGIINMKHYLLTTRVIPDLNNLIENFKHINQIP